jgi:hypothetical protein
MSFIKGVDIEGAWERRAQGLLDGTPVFLIAKADLIANKLAVGRPEDLADVARLTDQT